MNSLAHSPRQESAPARLVSWAKTIAKALDGDDQDKLIDILGDMGELKDCESCHGDRRRYYHLDDPMSAPGDCDGHCNNRSCIGETCTSCEGKGVEL